MIPMNQNNNECNQSHYSQYLSLPNLANMAVMPKFGEYAIDPAANMKVDFQASQNIDSLLQIHRRKMLRRAANRRSAQLSRARKKAHLEDLRIENTRLQRLVDILDSQPELVICITASGRITYLSDKTLFYIKINFAADESEEEPTHLNQILTGESAEKVLESIFRLNKHTASSNQEPSLIFVSKEVYFHDSFGQPMVGYMRCSKVVNRTPSHELVNNEPSITEASLNGGQGTTINGSVHKKPRKNATTAQEKSVASIEATFMTKKEETTNKGASNKKPSKTTINNSNNNNNTSNSVSNQKDWNLSNFKILTDCVSSLAESGLNVDNSALDNAAQVDIAETKSTKRDSSSNLEQASSRSGGSSDNNVSSMSKSNGSQPNDLTDNGNSPQRNNKRFFESIVDGQSGSSLSSDAEDEFVCVIRTADNCFVPHRLVGQGKSVNNGTAGGSSSDNTNSCTTSSSETASNSDLLMFSSMLSTASMSAHDLETSAQQAGNKRQRQGSPSESNDNSISSSGQSGAKPTSSMSKKNSTSSETGSDEF